MKYLVTTRSTSWPRSLLPSRSGRDEVDRIAPVTSSVLFSTALMPLLPTGLLPSTRQNLWYTRLASYSSRNCQEPNRLALWVLAISPRNASPKRWTRERVPVKFERLLCRPFCS
ncbi:hypothetical protein D3C78_1583640 [compost metagenome]